MPGLLMRIARHVLRVRRKSHSANSTRDHSAVSHQVTESIQNSTEIEEKLHIEDHKIVTQNKPFPNQIKDNQPVIVEDRNGYESSEDEEEQNVTTNCTSPSLPPMSANTVRAKRVLRELQEIMTVTQDPDHCFEVELIDECNIFEWEIRLVRPYTSSDLWKTMQETDTKHITFNLTFPDNFPFKPPFLRLVSPHIDHGFVMDGGAICLEVLTTQGWSSAYTIESLLVQVMAGMIQGGAIVSKKQNRKRNKLTKKRAEYEFKRISKIHAKYGWVSSDREDGL